MKKDEFGDRMKSYEVDRQLQKCLPTYMRLDGRSFSKFTKGLPRPFDPILTDIMIETTKELVKKFNCHIGYTQSDEISIGWGYREELEFPFFAGRIQKLTSVFASLATSKFNQLCYNRGGEYRYRAMEMLPSFDARVFQVDSNTELVNAFIWREQDCRKNAVTMAASTLYSHKELQNKNTTDKLEMMREAGVDFHSLPDEFKYGTYVKRELFETPLINVPEQYMPEHPVLRSRVVAVSHDKLFNSDIRTADRVSFWFNNDKNNADVGIRGAN